MKFKIGQIVWWMRKVWVLRYIKTWLHCLVHRSSKTVITGQHNLIRPVHLQCVPGNGEFKYNKHLTKVLTSIIFMSSASHAAANFSQYDDYAFPANYPAFLRGNPPEDKVLKSTKLCIIYVLGKRRINRTNYLKSYTSL